MDPTIWLPGKHYLSNLLQILVMWQPAKHKAKSQLLIDETMLLGTSHCSCLEHCFLLPVVR